MKKQSFLYTSPFKRGTYKKKSYRCIYYTLNWDCTVENTLVSNQFGWTMYDYLIENAVVETAATNIVTAIYLNYRYYDTLFEALMLLFSIIAVIYMSVHEGGEHYE